MDEIEQSPQWTTGVEVDGPVWAVDQKTGERATRHEENYMLGTIVAVDGNGKRAGYQTFEVYPQHRFVLLLNADMRETGGDNGEDNRHQGGGRAMLDRLDEMYPQPDWLMASSEYADHTQQGIDFMRSRAAGCRRKVHTERCALDRPDVCECFFANKTDMPSLDDQ